MSGKVFSVDDSIRDLDGFAREVSERLLASGLRETALPEEFGLKSSFGKEPLEIRPRAWVGAPESPLVYGRVVRIDGASRVQALNVVLIPRLGSGLPIFGAEILVFQRGVHLVVVDCFPTHESALEEELVALQGEMKREWGGRYELSELPEWGEGVFSPEVLILKPGAGKAPAVGPFVPAVDELLSAFLEKADKARGEVRSENRSGKALRKKYLVHHGEHEPAGPFLERISSPEWVAEFTNSYLFPRWLISEDQLPPWEEERSQGLSCQEGGKFERRERKNLERAEG